ncbi:MAG: leucine-rich repeat domain-containing protein [Bacteroidales bacterium]|nr:leucine-rich repeat domain-containing protein [Bacteroidales bacterium]
MKTTKQWTDTFGVSFEETETGVKISGVSKDSPLRRADKTKPSLQPEYIIPDGVTEIGDRAFEGCDGLHCVLIPSSVTKIGFGAFNGCEYLRSTINEVPEKFKGNKYMMCFYVSTFIIPNSVTEIGEWAFHSCKSLDKVIISNAVTKIKEHTFEYCSALRMAIIPASVVEIESNAFYNCRIKSVEIAKEAKFKKDSFDKGVEITRWE